MTIPDAGQAPAIWIFDSWSDLTSAVISVLLLIVSAVGVTAANRSLKASKRNNQTARLSSLSQLSQVWSSVYQNWILAKALARGPDDYYAFVSAEIRTLIASAHKRYQRKPWRFNEAVNHMQVDINRLVEFFDSLAVSILEGSLSPSDVYSILGPEVARHSLVVRWTVGAHSAPVDFSEAGLSGNDYGWVTSLPSSEAEGRVARVVYLSNALWTEGVRRRDISFHIVAGVAAHKQESGSGKASRRTTWALSKPLGGRAVARKLCHHLTYAEWVSKKDLCAYDEDKINLDEDFLSYSFSRLERSHGVRTWWVSLRLLRYKVLAP